MTDEDTGEDTYTAQGTGFAAPLVAGLVAREQEAVENVLTMDPEDLFD